MGRAARMMPPHRESTIEARGSGLWPPLATAITVPLCPFFILMKTAFAAFALSAFSIASAQQKQANYDESKVGEIVLPDVLKFASGEKVSGATAWEEKRRHEVLALFQQHVYGRIMPRLDDLKCEITAEKKDALGGTAVRKLIHVSLAKHPQWKGMEVMLYVPHGKKAPAPVFVGLSFNGNHAVTREADVPVSDRWMRPHPKIKDGVKDNRATENSRGGESSRWPLEKIIGQGFAVATAYYGDIEPDHAEGWKDGVRAALSADGANTAWKDGDWGAIGAWAWGLSRILDCLETDGDVDAKKAAVIGHSRLGKTSLWAGASDPRFAIVISNNSGEGGASLMRRNFGETTAVITRVFPHWFTRTYNQYAGNENACPVDQHMLIALMAPRPVYIASAIEDTWADPKGEFLSGKHAEPVYALFGKAGLGADTHPAVDQPVGDFIGYHQRTGKHDVLDYDWEQYLKFARRHFGL